MWGRLKELATATVGDRLQGMTPTAIAESLKELSDHTLASAVGKAHDLIREFNDTLPTIKALGLSVRDVSFKMGLPPELAATLTGSVEALDEARLSELAARHRDNKAVAAMVEALRAAASFKAQLGNLGFTGVRMDVRLGLLPSVQVGLLNRPDFAQVQ
jgi:hypothetical protein